MNLDNYSILATASSINKNNLIQRVNGTRFSVLYGFKKACITCHKGFNKKKGRLRVESSMLMEFGLKGYQCAKCFKK
jgi:hypothetical protein